MLRLPSRRRPTRSLIALVLLHDFLRGEIDAASRKRVADEEVVGLVREIVDARLKLRIVGDVEWQLDRDRDCLAVQRSERRLDRHGHLPGSAPRRRALQALAPILRTELAKAVLRFAAERHERMFRVEHCAHDTGVAALRGYAIEMALHGNRVG